ncbi:UvrD-helicase domain-containing protein [Natranaerobius thermophilus]|uniref:DNA 3'-5' helicase n=1 Tax=Natranaerobius thermophilus (strain ATCC BAA-1301 / DSM 18059 / JW/NM-WN-LF) TaxID=457570 RepID=B2A3Z4_NATTJ|nr:ATP-dependent helicase [Natranaerobius thermophilus]ACB85096.1 UvrD/REP helicase [Natranaerobius thermophilus JW/NM-WN-LF]
MEFSKQQQEFLKAEGNCLVLGGPGSGKTTTSLIKAKNLIKNEHLKNEQKILFLSFARATIARVEEQAGLYESDLINKSIEVNTYHGFAWNILRSHGYLLNSISPLKILPPQEACSRFSTIRDGKRRRKEKIKLFKEEGVVDFDLFAELCYELLSRSDKLLNVISSSYPYIILDEFQDTSYDEWRLINILGKRSTLVALADPDQRIYEFRGADPARISDYIKEFEPFQFDFASINNRSNGTDLIQFGNDLLSGANKSKNYRNVKIIKYDFKKGKGRHSKLKYQTLKVRDKLRKHKKNWSLAILVPTNNLMADVSNYLGSWQSFKSGNKLPGLKHHVAVSKEGTLLAAELILGIIENISLQSVNEDDIISDLVKYFRGRKGDKSPTQDELKLVSALENYLESEKIRGKNRKILIADISRIIKDSKNIELTGDPISDWHFVTEILKQSESKVFKDLIIDASNLKLLYRTSKMLSKLVELWREKNSYVGARRVFQDFILQEHFIASSNEINGIHLMTIHKSKGKEFDEVIIYEGFYQERLVRHRNNVDKARLNLRVACTRARRNTYIFTPTKDPCILIE